MTEWRPISTAPKDGTRMLLAQAGIRVEIGYWRSEDNGYYETVSKTGNRWVQEWVQTSSGYWDGTDEIYGPTHWMPLPAPPKDGE